MSERDGLTSTGPRDFAAFCSCGWLETGWPSARLALASLNAHRDKVHSAASKSLGAV